MRNSRPASADDLTAEHTAANLGRSESETRRSTTAVPVGNQTPLLDQSAPQGPSAATRMFGCLLQAGAAPFRVMWNYPRTTVALLVTAVNAVGQSCLNGTPGFEGAPQQYCNDAVNAMSHKMVVAGMVGTLFGMGAHMATDAVSRFRANRAEADAAVPRATR